MVISELESGTGIGISSEESTKKDTPRIHHSRLMRNMFVPGGIRMVRSMRQRGRSRRSSNPISSSLMDI